MMTDNTAVQLVTDACLAGHHTNYRAVYLACHSTTCTCPCHRDER